MSFFVTNAMAAATDTAAQQPNSMVSLLMMVGLGVVFYFLLWRPQSKRAKEHRELVSNLQKGDEIITSGGLIGKINKVDEKYILVSIAEGVEVKMQRNAISTVLPKGTLKSI